MIADTEHHADDENTRRPQPKAIKFLTRQTCMLLPFFGVVALANSYPSDHWAVRTALIGTTGYFLFTLTSLFHEAAHQTLPLLSKGMNMFVGRYIGTVLLVPYTVYRESHIRHHAYLNRPNDWELWPYSDPNTSLAFRRVFVWFDLLLGFLAAPYTYGRIYFHKNSPIKQASVRRTILVEYLAMLAFWSVVLTLVAINNAWMLFVISWVLPHWLAGILQNGRKMTEHLGMASFDPLQGTRTVMSRNWWTRICSWLNYDIFVHGPHHRYPRLTHDKLKGRMRDHLEGHPERAFPLYTSYASAFVAMFPSMVLRPGVGLNAGAASLNQVKVDDVAEFLEDEQSIVEGSWDPDAPVSNEASPR